MSKITITKDNFGDEVIKSELPVLIDFFAEWCGPCKMLAPVLDEVASEKEGTVKVAKINVDEQPDLASAFGISSIPTLVLIKNGKVENVSVGYIPKDKILEILK